MAPEAPKTYYFISDLHIGGDGALDACDFENELIAFLRRIAEGPRSAELIILGDAFGLWELTGVNPDEKMEWMINHHRALFEQFRETGKHLTITLLPGNHDYDLACVPACQGLLAEYQIQEDGKRIRVRYEVIPKEVRDDRTILEKLVILGKHRKGYEAIPAETLMD